MRLRPRALIGPVANFAVVVAVFALFVPGMLAQPRGVTAQGIFIDRSGSMKTYFASGLVQSIVTPLEATASAQGGLREFAFSTEVSPPRTLAQIETMPFGDFTFLDKVIDAAEARRLQVAWIVTDNIEDTGEAGNTERFYQRLRGADVPRITVFPVLAGGGAPGLLVYALLLDGGAATEYEATLAGFEEHGSGILRTAPLRMKPVDRDTVEVTSRSLTPLTRRGREKVYETGTPVRESVEVRFKSRFDHVQIVDSVLRVVAAAPAFQAGSMLTPERREVKVTPDRIRELSPGAETAQVYLLTVDLGRVSLRNSLAAWWKAAWNKSEEEEELDLGFLIDVPRQNFRLAPQFLNQYSAGSVAAARSTGKVYALDRLMAQVNAGDTKIQVSSPVYFRVRYPAWPAFFWLLVLATLLGMLAGVILLGRRIVLGRRRSWSVVATAAGGYPLQAAIEGDRVVVEGEAIARIEGRRLVPLGSTMLAGGQAGIRIEAGAAIQAVAGGSERQLVFQDRPMQHAATGMRPESTGPASTGPAGPARRR